MQSLITKFALHRLLPTIFNHTKYHDKSYMLDRPSQSKVIENVGREILPYLCVLFSFEICFQILPSNKDLWCDTSLERFGSWE